MLRKPQVFPQVSCSSQSSTGTIQIATENSTLASSDRMLWLQLILGYGLIMAAVWTPEGPVKLTLMLLATACIVLFSLAGRYSLLQMGLKSPTAAAAFRIVGYGILLACAIPLASMALGEHVAPLRHLPWHSAWQYTIWAMIQEFILQSFIYIRVESLFGSRSAVAVTALLFAAVHVPSPVLTLFTLIGGLFFCEMFRRYRSIIPLGVVHAMLGLTIAVSFSDGILHHMRVGIGYLTIHS